MNNQRRVMIALCLVVVAAILPALLLVFYVDPFQIYHKPFVSGMTLQDNQRYQNAGLINSYLADPAEGYDSVIIGTSMSQNFTGEMVAKKLKWKKPLRLLMPGAVAEEQLAVLRDAIHTGRVKHVLLELHPFLYQDTYRQKKQMAQDHSLYFPEFLYNNNLLDDTAYLFNVDVLKISWRIVMHQEPLKPLTPETIGYWANNENVNSDHAAFNSPENIAALQAQTAGFSVHARPESEIQSLDYPVISEALMPILKQYCDTKMEIDLFVPPWPRYRYQKSEKVALRSAYMMRRILEESSQCQNISLYDFDLLDFAGDMNNYKDEQHYLPAINEEILERISRQENKLTLENIGVFEQKFLTLLNQYKVYTSYTAPLTH